MPLFAITRPGLLAIATSVMALWSCIAFEKSLIRSGEQDAITSQRQLIKLRQGMMPVSHPVDAPARVLPALL